MPRPAEASAAVPAALYVIAEDIRTLDPVALALARLRGRIGPAGRLVLLVHPAVLEREPAHAALSEMGADLILPLAAAATGWQVDPPLRIQICRGYLQGLHSLRGTAPSGSSGSGRDPGWGPVLLTGAHAFGPVAGSGWEAEPGPGVGILAGTWVAPEFPGGAALGVESGSAKAKTLAGLRVPDLDFLVLSAELLAAPACAAHWPDATRLPGPAWDPLDLTRLLARAGLAADYLARADFATARPAVEEVHRLIAAGGPALPVLAFTLDPLQQDIRALRPRDALDALRRADQALYRAVVSFVSRELPLRDFSTIAEQYEVIPEHALGDPGRRRAFGTLAVFIHAFYAQMMPEFWTLVARLPADRHLFITTASAADRAAILGFLEGQGVTADAATVRVVEQNRGRDMSALFITWRDVVLSGAYPVALRLHSKRTPQVPRPVAESFKAHLFDNLVASPGHVSNILDRIEAEPDIGLVIPPVIHIGFATLGHSWFNNRRGVEALLKRMGLEVTLDASTPVAANGTMYWFRTEALRPMFETAWRWEDYNAEPDHVDGGLAHVQERLLAYVAQASGYRTLSVLTPQAAARGYAHLEYKLQRLAAYLPTGSIVEQDRELAVMTGTLRQGLYRRLRRLYGRTITRFPGARRWLRPAGQAVSRLLLAGRSS